MTRRQASAAGPGFTGTRNISEASIVSEVVADDGRLGDFLRAREAAEPSPPQWVGSELRQALAAITAVPAYVVGRRLDVLAWNDLARVLVADFPALEQPGRNMTRLVFLDPTARYVFPQWEHKARETVAYLRRDFGRHPDDEVLAELVEELSAGSEDFRRLWADHVVGARTRGRKCFGHPMTGDFELDYISLRAPDDPDLALVVYSAAPGSAGAAALRVLAPYAAEYAAEAAGGDAEGHGEPEDAASGRR